MPQRYRAYDVITYKANSCVTYPDDDAMNPETL
jgi:hypothetical protein